MGGWELPKWGRNWCESRVLHVLLTKVAKRREDQHLRATLCILLNRCHEDCPPPCFVEYLIIFFNKKKDCPPPWRGKVSRVQAPCSCASTWMRSTGGLVSIIVVSTLRYFSQKVNCGNVKSWRKSILPGFPWSAWRSWSPWGSWGWRRRASASGCRRTRPPPPPPSRRRHQTPRNPCQTALLVRLLICKVFIVDHIFLFLNLVSTCRHE